MGVLVAQRDAERGLLGFWGLPGAQLSKGKTGNVQAQAQELGNGGTPGLLAQLHYSQTRRAQASRPGCAWDQCEVCLKMVLKKHSAEGPRQGAALPMETYLEASQANWPVHERGQQVHERGLPVHTTAHQMCPAQGNMRGTPGYFSRVGCWQRPPHRTQQALGFCTCARGYSETRELVS